MNVVIHSDDGELENFRLEIVEVDAFVDLIRTHGYMDEDGNILVFEFAQVEPNRRFHINVGKE